jgi:hypothetical protein
MQGPLKIYVLISNVVVAILLIVAFEPLTETVEVINQNAVPMLKQLHERTDKDVRANNEEGPRRDTGQTFAFIERLLAQAQTEASRTKAVLRILVPWLLLNAAVSWWCFRTRSDRNQ